VILGKRSLSEFCIMPVGDFGLDITFGYASLNDGASNFGKMVVCCYFLDHFKRRFHAVLRGES